MTKKLTRRNFIKGGLATAAVGAATTIASPAIAKSTKFKWRMQTHWPPGVGYYKPTYEGFAKRVNEATGGEINITPLPPNAIVPTKDVLEAVGRGVFEISLIFPSYWIGRIPVAGHLNGQLFAWDNLDEMWFFLNEMGALDIIREAYAEIGLYQVGPVGCSGISLYSKKPLVTQDDFKGYKVRSTGIPAAVFEKMGATPVFFPGGELYQALQTGVCDGAHWGAIAAGWDMKLQEVTEYIALPFLAGVTNAEVFVNMKVWESLPDDYQRIIQDCVLATCMDSQAWFSYHNYLCKQEFVKKGGKISTMNPETVALMRKYSLDVVDEYSKKDPKYCGKVGALLHEYYKMTGRV